MPLDGGIALAQIKGDPDLQIIPVAVITGSQFPRAVLEIYARQANCCLPKPTDLPGFLDMMCFLAEFWLKHVLLPPKPRLKNNEPG